MIQPLWRTVWRFLKKLKIGLPYDPAIPLTKSVLILAASRIIITSIIIKKCFHYVPGIVQCFINLSHLTLMTTIIHFTDGEMKA